MAAASSSERTGLSVLGLDAELAATCVSCGLCLPHCPTFRVTGEEKYSPRGRIDAMRAVDRGELPIDDEFVDFVETCVQCRGCETGVPEWGAVRRADGDDPARARGRRHDHAVVAATRIPRPAAPRRAARRLDGARDRPAAAGRAEASRSASAAGAPGAPGRDDRRRRVAVHRMRDGRVATRDPSQHRHPGRAHRSHGGRARTAGWLLRGTARPRRTPRRGDLAGRARDGVDARRRRRSSSTPPGAARR